MIKKVKNLMRDKIIKEIRKIKDKLSFRETGGANVIAEVKIKKYSNASERYSYYGNNKVLMECLDSKGELANFLVIRKKTVEEAREFFEGIKEN